MSDLITTTGNQAFFNEDAKFFKDVYVYGKLYYDFDQGGLETFGDIEVLGNSEFSGIATFFGDVFINKEILNLQVGILTVTKEFYVGESPENNVFNVRTSTKNVGIGTLNPTQRLEVEGSIRIAEQIYDATASPGVIGAFLSKDNEGIKWVEFEPSFTEGIFVYNEGVLAGVSSFRGLNFITNSGGNLYDLVEANPNTDNPSIADIYLRSYWEKGPVGIFTNSFVGIGVSLPTAELEVGGNVIIQQDLAISGIITVSDQAFFNKNLTFNGIGVTFYTDDFLVTGFTTIQSDLSVKRDLFVERNLSVLGNADISNQLYVGSGATVAGGFLVVGISSFQNQVFVGASASVRNSLFVGAGATIFGGLLVGSAATIRGSTLIEQDLTVGTNLSVGGPSVLTGTLEVLDDTDLLQNLNVGGDADIDGELTVNQNAIIDGNLSVGLDGLTIKTVGLGSVGFGTAEPQKDIEFRRDVFFNGEAVYDSNKQVGFTSEFYQVPRSVFTQVGVGTTGQIISGRFFDAANLIRLNLDFIANEAVGFITSVSYKSPPFSLSTSNYTSCKDDVKDILKAITYDITRGGNSRCVGAGLSYYNGNTLIHINGVDDNGYSIQDASVDAVEKAVEIIRFVINNSLYPLSYQTFPINGTYADAARLLYLNKDFIAAEAVDRTEAEYPSLTIPGGGQNCIDDIKIILDAIIYNLQFGGNDRVYDAARFYVLNSVLLGEEVESVYAYEEAKSIAISIIRNEAVAPSVGNYNTFTQYQDFTIQNDPVIPKCQNQADAITSFVGIVTTAISNSALPDRILPDIQLPIQQIRDLTLQDDAERGSNTDPDGCSNVFSAISICAGIVTTIIEGGPGVSPNTAFPDGKVVWAPAGADSRNIIYVSKYGNDDNNGRTEGAAKLTIGAAAEVAQPGDTIMVRSGVYAENNPIGLRTDVTVSGQDLRLVTIYPQNDDDVFYVRRGCLIENLSFAYSKNPYEDDAPISIKGASVAFPPPVGIGSAKSGYLHPGPANEGPTGRWRSPYIRNCTNFMTDSIGMKIDGNHVNAAFSGVNNPGQDLKCMVCDSFTQYNENGIGVSISNNGYAQLVSIFTINCKIAIYADTGGSCDLTNSNSSFGIFGLYADGVGSLDFVGVTTEFMQADSDSVVLTGVADTIGNIRRPYNGQALYFKIDLSNYPDTPAVGILTAPMRFLSGIKVLDGGGGYNQGAPPAITVSAPLGPEGVIAEASANIDSSGKITSIDVTNSGRNYLPNQNIVITIAGGGGAIAEAITEPIYYTVSQATEPNLVGLTTVILDQFVPYPVGVGVSIETFRISRILTSSHSFEYVGTGVNINRANPFQGGVPIPENEVVAINGAQIPFTSTDQAGNFKIGEGLIIDQTTSTIRGRDFSRAIQAEVTPLILALR